MAYDTLDETQSVQLGVWRRGTRPLLGVSPNESGVYLEHRPTIQTVNSSTHDQVLMNVSPVRTRLLAAECIDRYRVRSSRW